MARPKVIFAEDEEQVDKLLELGDRLPSLRHIVYSDPRGMRKYDDPRLIPAAGSTAKRPRAARAPSRRCSTGSWMRPRGDDVAILCTTSGTTAHPKLAMLTPAALLNHCAVLSRNRPEAASDEYVSVLPLPWIMEQIYALGKALICPDDGQLRRGAGHDDARFARDRADFRAVRAAASGRQSPLTCRRASWMLAG